MFKDDYSKALDALKLSDEIKSKIYDKTMKKQRSRDYAPIWRTAFAAVVCIALALSVFALPQKTKPIETANTLAFSDTKSYDEIYKLLSKYENQYYYAKGDDFIIYEGITDAEADRHGASAGTSNGSATNNSASNKSDKFSETTTQVEGVTEADVVKTDGSYIYTLATGEKYELIISKADGDKTRIIDRKELSASGGYGEMFLNNDTLVILQTDWQNDKGSYASILCYDISNPSSIREIGVCRQKGSYYSARMVDGVVYMISNTYINPTLIEKARPETYVPTIIYGGGEENPVEAQRIYKDENGINYPSYTTICSYNPKEAKLISSLCLLGRTDTIYSSTKNIITATNRYADSFGDKEAGRYKNSYTDISRISFSKGELKYMDSASIDGTLENQFFIDEHNETFRFVTTVNYVTVKPTAFANTDKVINEVIQSDSCAQLTVLDSSLKPLGKLENLAPDERVYSVRFMGDLAYFVTFKQVDPLFAVDLSEPSKPTILSELKIPGFSDYLYPYGDGKLFGIGRNADEKTGAVGDMKLSMFDISNPKEVFEADYCSLDGYSYSEALFNHKAILVSSNKNLIGFASMENSGKTDYLLYTYYGGFKKVATLQMPRYYGFARGIFIDDTFYIVTDNSIYVYDLNTLKRVSVVDFKA